MTRCRGAWLAVLLSAAACAHGRTSPGPTSAATPGPQPSPAPAAGPRVEEGLASFYGHRHKGRRTANGERYDPAALTCAHRSQPFGARLQVTDLDTGRQVVVTVNDRGPFVRGRVIDLSLAAARELGMVGRGVARVRVERLGP